MEVWHDTLNPVETCLNTSHRPSITCYGSCTISSQLPYSTSEPCQHWGKRAGKTHHSTMILKYQNLFHLVKTVWLPNKTNANIAKYARFWVILLWKLTFEEPQIHPTTAQAFFLFLWPFHIPTLKSMGWRGCRRPEWTNQHAFMHLVCSTFILTGFSF